MKPLKVLAALAVALAVIFGMVWILVMPEALKQIISFERWRKENTRASGHVEREPGTRIFWEEYGVASGPPVLVLHGAFGSIGTMGPQIRALAPTHRVIAIEARGHNKSSNALDTLTYEMMADDAVAVMDAVRIMGAADVVGWSDGGNVGIDLARRHPTRVRKVVALGAVYDNTGADAQTIESMRTSKAEDSNYAPMRAAYVRDAPVPEKWPVFFKQVQTMLLTEPRWTLEQLATIRAPVLLVNGEHDLVRPAHATEMKNAIPSARLEIVKGAGHEAPLARADDVNALLLPFLTAPTP
jgi:pimeloyl-ACP methyl ester carboxylesterase